MKKSLLLLSVMAAAAFSASAYDTFAPGTDAENPNYYLIRTNRGNGRGSCYLSYSGDERPNVKYAQLNDEEAVAAAAKTHLYRADSATEYSLWEVTPGTESGTMVVKNYAENVYLMTAGADPADVTDSPVNLYLVTKEDKSFSIGTAASGAGFLDANNYNDNCGHWYPGDEGTTWFATLVDLTNGDSVEKAIQYALYSSEASASKTSALTQLQGYAAIDVVADIITTGIESINAVEVSADAVSQIESILSSTLSEANAFLATGLAGKTYGLLNLRREGGNYAYVSTNITTTVNPDTQEETPVENYIGVMSMLTGDALFEFKGIDGGGYHLYNKETNTYMSTAIAPVEDEASAITIFPVLNSWDGYVGLSFPFKAERSQWEMCLNFNGGNGALTQWYIDYDAAGSIWALKLFDEDAVVKEVTETYINHLNEYAANVEPCAEIFNESISKIEALTFSATLGEEAEAIETEAIAAANEFLKAGLNEKSVQLRSLRNGYVVPGAEWYAIAAEPSDASNYDFISGENGGYIVFNASNNHYMGAPAANGGNQSVTQTADAAEAQHVYPVISSYGDFYGVAFPLEDGGNWGLNTNAEGLHTYYTNDSGSIFAIKVMGPSNAIDEISAAPAREGIYDLQGRRLAAPIRGINIINGRKVLVK